MTTPAERRADAEIDADLDLVVRHRELVADNVVRLVLASPADEQLPPWSAGAHVDVILPPDIVRQYSLCGDPGDRTSYTIAVLLEADGRGGSKAVHTDLAEGSPIRVRGPRNSFPLLPAPSYLFLAGGIGITPILPMISAAEAAGASWRLVYGGRTRTSMAFAQSLTQQFGDRVQVCPQDETGLLDLDALLPGTASDTLVYCCGPEPLLLAVEQRKGAGGSLHVERFVPKAQGAPVRAADFVVELSNSGKELVVTPAQSILEVVEAAGVQVLSSCREGTCGTCETAVLAGLVDHRDSLLDDDEQAANDTMMICVSRAAGDRLVLEL